MGIAWYINYIIQIEDEMKNAKEEDLLYFRTKEDLRNSLGQNAVIVGVLFESTGGKFGRSEGISYRIALEVTNNSIVNYVYPFLSTSRLYKQSHKLNRETQTRLNRNASYPTADVDMQLNYIKSEYDADGNIIAGTHNGSYAYGNSLLVISGSVSLVQEIDNFTDSGERKVNYDIGKNETEVTYKLSPKLSGESEINGIVVTL